MIYGFLIAFFITLVIGVSVAIVIVIALREVSDHIYEGGGSNTLDRRYRSHLERARDAKALEGKGRKSSRHHHYHA